MLLNFKSSLLLILLCFFLCSCSIYTIDIRQGNIVTQEMLDQLELNMPARKVQFIMGTPLLKDITQSQRWDYIYSLKQTNQIRKQRRITLFFDETQHLIRVDGDVRIGKSLPKPEIEHIEYPEDTDPIL